MKPKEIKDVILAQDYILVDNEGMDKTEAGIIVMAPIDEQRFLEVLSVGPDTKVTKPGCRILLRTNCPKIEFPIGDRKTLIVKEYDIIAYMK